MRVAVAGGGIAGLALAHRLGAGKSADVTVFEAEDVAGGKIRSERVNGYLFEWGPNGFLTGSAELRALVNGLDLAHELSEASPAAANRYIFWNGALYAVPSKPPQVFGTKLLSAGGKLRALREPFVRAPAVDGSAGAVADDESVYAFAARRFGIEVAERVVAPALLGVSGGDARETSLDALFPRIRTLEREHGSVLRGVIRSSRTAPRRVPGRLATFGTGGMSRLIERLAERLGPRLRTATPVRELQRDGNGWRVAFATPRARPPNNEPAHLECDQVVLAVPAFVAADFVAPFAPDLATDMRAIAYAPMRVVGIAFERGAVPHALDGFGFLAARDGGVRILGGVFTSSIFPMQAPPATAYLRVFLGGAQDAGVTSLDAAAVRAIVRRDLRTVLGVTAEPLAYHERVWAQAIPQYGLEHRSRLRRIEARLATLPGLHLAGNAFRGLGLGDDVRDALDLAARVQGTADSEVPEKERHVGFHVG